MADATTWRVWQRQTRLDTGEVVENLIGTWTVTPGSTPPTSDLLQFFGITERKDVSFSSPASGVIEATIQFSPINEKNWAHDPETPYRYIVTFRAVRLDPPNVP